MEKCETQNKKEIYKILQAIKNMGYTVIDVSISDTYFIISDEADSICNFKIKELKGFIFGLWNVSRFDNIKEMINQDKLTWADYLGISSKSKWIFFCQYLRDFDKFKPSYSGFITGICSYGKYWNMDDIENILKFIKKHPIKSAQYVSMQTKHIWEQQSNIKLFKDYCLDWLYEIKYRMEYNNKVHKAIHRAKSISKDFKDCEVLITDMGNCWSPRINLYIDTGRIKDVEIIDEYRKLMNNYEYKYTDINILEANIDQNIYEDEKIIFKK